MKIFFESYIYNNEHLVNALAERYFIPVDSEHSVVEYVGYYFDSEIGDAVIILPKVFIHKNSLAFGRYNPKELVDCNDSIINCPENIHIKEIIFEISSWMYQAILLFKKRNPSSTIVYNEYINTIISNLDSGSTSELDIILSLTGFYKENKNLFVLVSKTSHSGYNRINWKKTVSKKIPYIVKDKPLYTDIISNRKNINFDEELLVIFYSVLYFLSQKYGFNIVMDQNYDLIKGHNFDMLLRNGTRKLRSIKTKYFSDKFIRLWDLLYVFFDRYETVKRKENKFEEVLLIKDFNIVFEDMIDDLIGDNNLPSYLKNHKDGKQIDHIYKYKSLLANDDIYFVGDSKYYKPSNSIEAHSIAKQYTYAKNVIQYNIDLFYKDRLDHTIRYRDELTEGYNITPNFFISALIDDNLDFTHDGLSRIKDIKPHNFHFNDRLFDRDTLFLQTYNINFLFVLSAYISRNASLKNSFRSKARKQFRDKMTEYFQTNYVFYKVTPKSKISDFVNQFFKLLNGKMYRPSQMDNSLIISFRKTESESENNDPLKSIPEELYEKEIFHLS